MLSCAKINLYLRIIGKRADGYHDIQTLFLPLPELADELAVSLSDVPGITMSCSEPSLPTNQANLCVKAAELFCQQLGIAPHLAIKLEKRIPIAAGLGGGSSNAATVLRELRRLLAPELPADVLLKLACRLGADVPFFLDPQPAIAEGIGERLRGITVRTPLALVLAHPGFPVPASWAYGHWRRTTVPALPPLTELLGALQGEDWRAVAALCGNDLEHAVLDKFPALGIIAARMAELGCAGIHVSGSGPSLFGLCEPAQATNIRDALQKTFPDFLGCYACHYRPAP
jgi:4-diphosphocytidyl-2-C-methyl-D-erythritol kinase